MTKGRRSRVIPIHRHLRHSDVKRRMAQIEFLPAEDERRSVEGSTNSALTNIDCDIAEKRRKSRPTAPINGSRSPDYPHRWASSRVHCIGLLCVGRQAQSVRLGQRLGGIAS